MNEEEEIVVNIDQSDIVDFFKINSNVICADILSRHPREFVGTIKFRNVEYNFWRLEIKGVDGDFVIQIYVEDFSLQEYKPKLD